MKSPIGLDTVQSQALAAELNRLLASYQILYMNVRGFHWNIRGNQFFELHLKFDAVAVAYRRAMRAEGLGRSAGPSA